MQTCTQRGPYARDEKQTVKKTRLIQYKRTRDQDNKRRKITTTKNTMTRTKKDTETENRRSRHQMIKQRIQENKGTRDKIIQSSVGALTPRTYPLRKQDNKTN